MTTSSTTPMGTDALLSAITLTHPYLLQQDQLSQLLDLSNAATPVTTPTTTTTTMTNNNQLQASNNFMIDDWLADELQHSGLLTQQHDLSITTTPTSFSCSSDVSTPPSSLLPQSPPLTASPVKETHQHHQQSSSPGVSLFPDIWPASNAATTAVSVPVVKQQSIAVRPAQPQQQQQQRPRPVPIMPKTTEMSMSSPSTPTTPQVVGGKRKASSALLSDKEQDDIALKRQRNTDAARRSRLKKLLKMESLENRVTELEGENTRLTTRVAVLESEKSGLESKDKEMQERIRVLEEQLAEAHKALTSKCSH